MILCHEILPAHIHAEYIFRFIDTYRIHENDNILSRECLCTRMRIPYAYAGIEDGDIFAGRYRTLAVGFSPQENGFGFFLNKDQFQEVYEASDKETQEKLNKYLAYWEIRVSEWKLRDAFPKDVAQVVGSDRFFGEPGVGFYLSRIGGTHPDYDKLVRLGIDGLADEIRGYMACGGSQKTNQVYSCMLETLDTFTALCEYYEKQAEGKSLCDMALTLRHISRKPPTNLREAIQLVHLYAIFCGSINYGRMDVYLGDFLPDDNAVTYLCDFWKLLIARENIYDTRVIIGGVGRRNQESADKFALYVMEASRIINNILPQLTLRFYDGQNPSLISKAYDNFAQGIVYPMLYNDNVNIPSVQKAFGFDSETAAEYLPFGCGEYVINHRSLGSPNGTINLLKALEDVLEQADYSFFDELFDAYRQYVEKHVEALAKIEALEYEIASREAGFLPLSILFDDCLAKGMPLINGVRYLGGTLESYGNINAADSLTAIRETVYEKKLFSLAQLKEMLERDFAGYERERQILISCPKYGNDNKIADSMVIRIHEHLCNCTRSQAEKVGLHSYLIVIINNSANTIMGRYTKASADGRKAYTPMANANNPSSSADKEGVTAFLNSLVKLDTSIHAGAVQNMKFSKTLLTKHRPQFEALMKIYFENGGAQAMLNVLSKNDLENAVIHPELYTNLIVRVGGFCARFIELDKDVQQEIIDRTLY
jgi:pyruvate-formate lyase